MVSPNSLRIPSSACKNTSRNPTIAIWPANARSPAMMALKIPPIVSVTVVRIPLNVEPIASLNPATVCRPAAVNFAHATTPPIRATASNPTGDNIAPMVATINPPTEAIAAIAPVNTPIIETIPPITEPATMNAVPTATIAAPATASTAPTFAAVIISALFSVTNFLIAFTIDNIPVSTSIAIGATAAPISNIVAPITRRTRLMASVI